MNNKILIVLFFSCSLLYNCSSKNSDKNEKMESALLIDSTATISNELNTIPTGVKVRDSTNYLTDCFFENSDNGEQSFKSIEKLLLEQNILKTANPKGYKDFFITYVLPQQFGGSVVKLYDINKEYFQNQLKIATILRANLNTSDINNEKQDACFKTQMLNENFEYSSTKAFSNKVNEITDQLVDGTFNIESKTQFKNMINNHFSIELFKNKDSRLMGYFQLSKFLKEYDKEQMNIDYSNFLMYQEEFKENEKNKSNSTSLQKQTKVITNQPEIIEVEEMTEEEAAAFKKNGGVIESTDPNGKL